MLPLYDCELLAKSNNQLIHGHQASLHNTVTALPKLNLGIIKFRLALNWHVGIVHILHSYRPVYNARTDQDKHYVCKCCTVAAGNCHDILLVVPQNARVYYAIQYTLFCIKLYLVHAKYV